MKEKIIENKYYTLGNIMVDGKWTGDQIQGTLDDTENYYKTIIKDVIPYIKDFIGVLEGESSSSYYSHVKGRIVLIKELEYILNKTLQESYGTK